MTGDCGLFDATKGLSTPIEICMGDDTCYDVRSCGDVQLHLSNDMFKKLKDVWYVPGVKKNLISIGQLVEKDMDVLFNKHGCTITSSNTGEVLVTRRKVGRMFILNDTEKKWIFANEKNEFELWHKRLGHVRCKKIVKYE